ncbi:MAG: hypothetical protein QME66_09855 [Candidatus Eisenbacteria bacterium]|nr:hypothetical protein [Candidatus Eisenbacteria bacterium]
MHTMLGGFNHNFRSISSTPGRAVDPSEATKRVRRHSLVLYGLILLLGLLYLLTFSHVSSLDALYYFHNYEQGGLKNLLHPHHLVFEFSGKGWFELWRGLGYTGRVDLPAKTLSLAAAIVALVIFARTLALVFGTGFLTPALLLVFGLSYNMWHMATEAEPVIFFILFSNSILYLLLRLLLTGNARRSTGWALGLVNAAGVLFHQELILAIPFCLAVLWKRIERPFRTRTLLTYLGVTCGIILLAYWLAATLGAGARGLGGMVHWVTSYRTEFAAGCGRFSPQTPVNTLRGAASMFLGGTALKGWLSPGSAMNIRFVLAFLPFLGLALAVVLSLVSAFARLQSTRIPAPGLVILLVVWLVVFAGFAAWWMPQNRNFWAPVLPALVLLCGLGLETASGRSAASQWRRIALVVWILALLGGNLFGGILQKHSQSDARQELAVRLSRIWEKGDLLLLPLDRTCLAMTFYHPEIRCVGLEPGLVQQGTRLVAGMPALSDTEADSTWTTAASAAYQTMLSGNRVLVSSDLVPQFAMYVSNFMPAGSQTRLVDLFEFSDSVVPQDQKKLFELRLEPR